MKRKKLLFIVVFTLLTTICCEKEFLIEHPKEQIIGTWEWVKSIDPRSGVVIIPVTEGYYGAKIFMANDTVKNYINNILQNKYPYYFKLMNEVMFDVPETDTRMMLIINGKRSFYSIDNDTLIIDFPIVMDLQSTMKDNNNA